MSPPCHRSSVRRTVLHGSGMALSVSLLASHWDDNDWDGVCGRLCVDFCLDRTIERSVCR